MNSNIEMLNSREILQVSGGGGLDVFVKILEIAGGIDAAIEFGSGFIEGAKAHGAAKGTPDTSGILPGTSVA